MQTPDRIISALLHWFRENARDLPWRQTRDPYAIWVSEVMLQQTQVKTVIPYWTRWMSVLPDIHSLARIPEQQLLKLWEGLGYYTRARNLQKAAQLLVENHGGKIPASAEELIKLPGVGRYTAGAIASLASNQPAPILDGNVVRVLTRLLAIPGDPKDKEVNALLWQRAGEFVQRAANFEDQFPRSCGMFNESLMELGATICAPRQPRCEACPVRRFCLANRHGSAENYPQLPKREKATARTFVAIVFHRRGKVLVRQREAGMVNGGLWEFPNLEVARGTTLKTALERLGAQGLTRKFTTIKHTITRYRMTLDVYLADPEAAGVRMLKYDGARWIDLQKTMDLPFSSAHARVRDALLEKVSGN